MSGTTGTFHFEFPALFGCVLSISTQQLYRPLISPAVQASLFVDSPGHSTEQLIRVVIKANRKTIMEIR